MTTFIGERFRLSKSKLVDKAEKLDKKSPPKKLTKKVNDVTYQKKLDEQSNTQSYQEIVLDAKKALLNKGYQVLCTNDRIGGDLPLEFLVIASSDEMMEEGVPERIRRRIVRDFTGYQVARYYDRIPKNEGFYMGS